MNEVDEDEMVKLDDCLGWDFSLQMIMIQLQIIAQNTTVLMLLELLLLRKMEREQLGLLLVKIMSIKFYGDTKWTSTTVLNSYVYAVDNGAHVINTSFNVDRFAKDPIYECFRLR